MVGVSIPLIPTTPFLLIAAFCFARASEKINNWFKNTKIYKNNLESLANHEGMTVKSKVKTLSMVTALLIIALIMMRNVEYAIFIIGTVWLGHIIVFTFFVKTKK